ncbi:hypothetical protein [Rickettsia endosymbiont of Orchestes rusci]|uniref:hypothetical protein n=1 Tax=Rickettsia endosymbiont of Orchestes rusci TaxID=3066250 RepID=UPI00313C9A55
MDHNYRIMIITSTVSYRGPSHGIRKNLNKKTGCRGRGLGMTPDRFAKMVKSLFSDPRNNAFPRRRESRLFFVMLNLFQHLFVYPEINSG